MSDYKSLRIDVLLLATCQLDCWKETRDFLQEMRIREPTHDKRYNNHDIYQKAIALVSDPENTARRLTKTKPRLRTEGKETLEDLERFLSAVFKPCPAK